MGEFGIKLGDIMYDEFGIEYIITHIDINDCITLKKVKKVNKVVKGYVNIFYDKKYDQITTGITYMDKETAERNGQSDPNYVKTIEIDNKEEGENKQ